MLWINDVLLFCHFSSRLPCSEYKQYNKSKTKPNTQVHNRNSKTNVPCHQSTEDYCTNHNRSIQLSRNSICHIRPYHVDLFLKKPTATDPAFLSNSPLGRIILDRGIEERKKQFEVCWWRWLPVGFFSRNRGCEGSTCGPYLDPMKGAQGPNREEELNCRTGSPSVLSSKMLLTHIGDFPC